MKEKVALQCFPLYSVLKALNQTTVDFLSLDVEGAEYEILASTFDKGVAKKKKDKKKRRRMEEKIMCIRLCSLLADPSCDVLP